MMLANASNNGVYTGFTVPSHNMITFMGIACPEIFWTHHIIWYFAKAICVF